MASTLPFTAAVSAACPCHAVRCTGEEAGVSGGHTGVDGHAVLRSCVLVACLNSLRDGVDVPAGGRLRRRGRFGRRFFLFLLCRFLCRCRRGCGSRFILRRRRGYCRLFRCSGRCRFSGCRLLFRGFIHILRTRPLDRQQRIRTAFGFFLLLRHFSLVRRLVRYTSHTLCCALHRRHWQHRRCGVVPRLPAGCEQQEHSRHQGHDSLLHVRFSFRFFGSTNNYHTTIRKSTERFRMV